MNAGPRITKRPSYLTTLPHTTRDLRGSQDSDMSIRGARGCFLEGRHANSRVAEAMKAFRPTPESIPPRDVSYRLRLPSGIPVHKQPLVRGMLHLNWSTADLDTRQNPLIFLLKAAQIYPRKLAIAHPDVPHPVFYSYEVWSV